MAKSRLPVTPSSFKITVVTIDVFTVIILQPNTTT